MTPEERTRMRAALEILRQRAYNLKEKLEYEEELNATLDDLADVWGIIGVLSEFMAKMLDEPQDYDSAV